MKKIMMITLLTCYTAINGMGVESSPKQKIVITTESPQLAEMILKWKKIPEEVRSSAVQLLHNLVPSSDNRYPLKKEDDKLYLFCFETDSKNLPSLEEHTDIIKIYKNKKEIEKLEENTETYGRGFFVKTSSTPQYKKGHKVGYRKGIENSLLFSALTVAAFIAYNQLSLYPIE